MKKLKNKLIVFLSILYANFIIIVGNMEVAFAGVTFNKASAQNDIKKLCDPISDVLIFAALPITGLAIGWSYLSWAGKDPEEKENMPFVKTVKKQIIAFVIFGLAGSILKWFSIS